MATASSSQSHAAKKRGDALRVLVAEEEVESAHGLEALLSEWGCDVHVCQTGSAAVASAQEHQPHVALISLSLPDMRGRDVVHGLCRCKGTHNLLLISLSTEDQEVERGVANALGFDFHLIKPIDACEFHRALAQLARDEELPVRPLN